MKISAVMINSEQPQVLGAFYTKVFGEPGWHDGDWFGFSAGAGLMVGPHSEIHGKNETPARIMITVECKDVEESFKKVTAMGAEVIAEPYQPGKDGGDASIWLATVADPDGNYLQLSTPWPS